MQVQPALCCRTPSPVRHDEGEEQGECKGGERKDSIEAADGFTACGVLELCATGPETDAAGAGNTEERTAALLRVHARFDAFMDKLIELSPSRQTLFSERGDLRTLQSYHARQRRRRLAMSPSDGGMIEMKGEKKSE